jgi:hypothetical protein
MPSSWEEPKQSSSSGSPFGWLLVLVAVFVIGSYVGPIDWKWSSAPDGDKKEQVEPAPVSLEGVSIVCIVENKTMTADETLFFRDKEEFAKQHGLRMILRLDKELSASEPYVQEAMRKGVEVPFAAYVKNKDIYKVVPLPKTKEELLK